MNNKNVPLSFSEVEKRFNDKGLKLLTREYKNNHRYTQFNNIKDMLLEKLPLRSNDS